MYLENLSRKLACCAKRAGEHHEVMMDEEEEMLMIFRGLYMVKVSGHAAWPAHSPQLGVHTPYVCKKRKCLKREIFHGASRAFAKARAAETQLCFFWLDPRARRGGVAPGL